MTPSDCVRDIVRNVLFTEGELVHGEAPREGAVKSEGIVQTFVFHEQRLKDHAERIKDLALRVVDDDFHLKGGGGMSFLNLPLKGNEQWADQKTAEELFMLCKALGWADYCMPREVWSIMPGGVPYLFFDLPE